MTYTYRSAEGFTPGIFTNSAGYVYDTARKGWSRTDYSWRGGPVNRKAFHTYQFGFTEAELQYDATYYTGTSWQRGSALQPGSFALRVQDPPSYASLYAKLLDNLNEKVRGSIDLSVDIAEAGSTVRMFNALDHFDQFNKSFFRTRKLSRLLEATKWAGQQWLIYTYGVKPLVSTIYGAANESIRICLNATERFKVRVTESKGDASVSLYLWSGGYSQWLRSAGTNKRSLSLVMDIKTDGFDLARWTSLNPVSLAWELTPFSFVTDWFVDIGSFIRNYETALLYSNRFNGGCITDLTALDVSIYDQRVQPFGWNLTYSGSAKSRGIIRDVLNTYPVPRLPSFEANLGSSRLLSSAALLSQLLNKRS